MIMPTWVVFDVAGVILDIRLGLIIITEYLGTTQEHLLKVFDKYRKKADLGVITPEECWEKIAEDLGSSKTDGKEILKTYLSGCLPLHWGFDLAQKLKERGYKLAACSNTWRGISEAFWPLIIVNGVPVFSIFEEFIESCTVQAVKPESPIYYIVERKLDASGSQIFFIDDSLENIDTAKSFGWQTYHFKLKRDYGRSSCVELAKIFRL